MRELLQEEGVRFDINGRIGGGAFRLRDAEEKMKGTMLENYIGRLPYRFGGWA
jgi:hypothetical protein